MPSTTGTGSADQRLPRRRRLIVLSVVLVTVLTTITPFVAVAGVAGSSAPSAPASVVEPHENATGGNLTLLVGSARSYDALDGVDDVATAHRAGELEADDRVRVSDTLVVAFAAERLGAEYADTTGPNATVRFFQALDATNASLNVTSPSGTSCERLRVDLRESRHRVLADAESGSFRLLLDTAALEVDGGCDGELDVPGRYQVALERSTRNGTSRRTEWFDLLARPVDPGPDREIATYRAAPALAGELRTAGELRRGIGARELERSSVVVPDEVAVLELRSARLARAYANATGPNATRRLLRAANATGGRFAVIAERPGGPEPVDGGTETETDSGAPPGVALLGPGVSTVADRGNDTFYLVLDTGRMRLREGGETVPPANDSDIFLRPSLTVPGGDPERYEGRLVVGEPDGVVAVARNASVDGTRELAVVGTDGTFVARVGSNLAVNSELTLRVQSGDETLAQRTFPAERGTLDRPEGPPDATFDLGPLPAGRTLTLTLARNGTTFHRAEALVGERPTLRDAIVRRVRRGPEGSTIRFGVTAHFPGPGYVVVQNRSGRYIAFPVTAGEPVRVNGTIPIQPRDEEAPRPVRLIAVYDSNRNGQFDGPGGDGPTDRPFPSDDGQLLARTAQLPPPSPTPTVTAPPPGTTLSVTDAGAPGFGPLAALFGVLGLVGLLAVRRGRGGSP
jgi:hypothetical protein